MPRVNERRVVHKSTGGIPPKIPTPVGSVGNAHNHLTPNTVALSTSPPVVAFFGTQRNVARVSPVSFSASWSF